MPNLGAVFFSELANQREDVGIDVLCARGIQQDVRARFGFAQCLFEDAAIEKTDLATQLDSRQFTEICFS